MFYPVVNLKDWGVRVKISTQLLESSWQITWVYLFGCEREIKSMWSGHSLVPPPNLVLPFFHSDRNLLLKWISFIEMPLNFLSVLCVCVCDNWRLVSTYSKNLLMHIVWESLACFLRKVWRPLIGNKYLWLPSIHFIYFDPKISEFCPHPGYSLGLKRKIFCKGQPLYSFLGMFPCRALCTLRALYKQMAQI